MLLQLLVLPADTSLSVSEALQVSYLLSVFDTLTFNKT